MGIHQTTENHLESDDQAQVSSPSMARHLGVHSAPDAQMRVSALGVPDGRYKTGDTGDEYSPPLKRERFVRSLFGNDQCKPW